MVGMVLEYGRAGVWPQRRSQFAANPTTRPVHGSVSMLRTYDPSTYVLATVNIMLARSTVILLLICNI